MCVCCQYCRWEKYAYRIRWCFSKRAGTVLKDAIEWLSRSRFSVRNGFLRDQRKSTRPGPGERQNPRVPRDTRYPVKCATRVSTRESLDNTYYYVTEKCSYFRKHRGFNTSTFKRNPCVKTSSKNTLDRILLCWPNSSPASVWFMSLPFTGSPVTVVSKHLTWFSLYWHPLASEQH